MLLLPVLISVSARTKQSASKILMPALVVILLLLDLQLALVTGLPPISRAEAIEDSVVYFQPIFLEETGGAFPEFRRVAVVYADRVEWADTLVGALELVFGPAGLKPLELDHTFDNLAARA